MSRSVAAIVHGYRTFDPAIDVAGVVFNRVGSERHEQLLRDAIEPLGVPVLGALRRDPSLVAPERHLGLVPAAERVGQARAALGALTAAIERQVDLDGILALAGAASPLTARAWSPSLGEPTERARIAVARGPAFSFHYPENLELLAAAGAELLEFDPLADERLPSDAGALLLAGGFPEVFGAELQANASLREDIAALAAAGKPILAECGGLLFLCRELDGRQMCGVLPVSAQMTERLTLSYREATAATATPWLERGQTVRGHEFHYTRVDAPGSAPAWRQPGWTEGIVLGSVQASYLHVHWAAYPELARRFARAAARIEEPVGAR
jgi:cobyrinic acid a,c-diamide synthase